MKKHFDNDPKKARGESNENLKMMVSDTISSLQCSFVESLTTTMYAKKGFFGMIFWGYRTSPPFSAYIEHTLENFIARFKHSDGFHIRWCVLTVKD